MRRLQLVVLIVLCLAPALALFADEPAAPAAPGAITQTIESLGTPPDFTGRWLVLAGQQLQLGFNP